MALFDPAFDVVMVNEGGYSNHPNDKGGETYAGIARVYFPNWDGWKIVDKYKPLKSEQKINNPELSQLVRDWYKKEKWSKAQGDRIGAQFLATYVFDVVVNHGSGIAKVIQRGLNKALKAGVITGAALPESNTIADKTLALLNQNPNAVYPFLLDERAIYYKYLATIGGNGVFLKGWMNRLNSFRQTAVANVQAAYNYVASTVIGSKKKISIVLGVVSALVLLYILFRYGKKKRK